LQGVLVGWNDLAFAVLVGSRAAGTERSDSDWDIALYWCDGQPWLDRVAKTETLRRECAKALGVLEARIDLIDLANSNLAMRAAVAEEGLPLTGGESVAWARFLRRTWRELEDFYWEKERSEHAA
jgi:predicted nucleotidyltransferase